MKPGLQFQGKYVFGNALNTNEPLPAKTILAVMINPSYGATAFVARLVPGLKLKDDFLFNIVKSVITLAHEAEGYVFGLFCDN